MQIKICRFCQNCHERFEVEIKFDDKTEWHLAELIESNFDDIFPEENIKNFFKHRHIDGTNCIQCISVYSYYYMLQILWNYKICKYDPNEYNAYFGIQKIFVTINASKK